MTSLQLANCSKLVLRGPETPGRHAVNQGKHHVLM